MTGGALQVPLNIDTFRRYRNMQARMARKGLVMTLGSCVFLVFALYSMSADSAGAGEWEQILFLVLVVIGFVGCATWPAMQLEKVLTRTLTQNLPALVIDNKGICDYSSNYVFGFIPWSEIENVTATSRFAPRINQTFPGIAFVVKNKEVLLRRKPGLMKMWLGLDQEITNRRQVFIPQGRLDLPVEEVVRFANEWRNQNITARA
jgi:hypothetical protein